MFTIIQFTEDAKHHSQWTQFNREWPGPNGNLPRDLPAMRRKGDLVISTKRLGKDEKLAKEAKIPFTVKVGGEVKSYLRSVLCQR